MKLLRRFLAPLLALCFALTSAPVGALPPARTAAILSGVQGWSFPGSSADLYFARNGGSCTINRLLKPCASLLTTTRASTGYAQWADGHLSLFAANVPRITDLGLLVEQAATNLALQSQTFTGWSNNTVTANAVAAPNGTVTGGKLIEMSAGSGSVSQNTFVQVTASGSTAYTHSIYAKAGERSWIYFRQYDGTNNSGAYFNLATGAIGHVDSGVTASIVPSVNGWYRCIITFTTIAGATLERVQVAMTTGDFPALAYVGDGTSGLYIWGAQLELGTVATSYIATTTVSAARAVDNEAAAGALLSALQGSSGTAIVSVNGGQAATVGTILGLNALIGLGKTAADKLTTALGGTQTSGNSATWTGPVKVGLRWTSGTVSIVLNGGTIVTAANTPPAITSANIGSTSGSSAAVNQYIKRLTVFSSSVSDSAFQALTQ